MRNRLLGLLAIAVVAGCDDPVTPVQATPEAPAGGSVAYLTVSNPSARAGSLVTVTAVVRRADLQAIGAFKAKLTYDAAALTYVGEGELGSGMRALNPRDGQVVAAGASADGFANGELFAVTFKVVDPVALQAVALDVSELTGTGFDDQLPKLRVHRERLFGAPRR